MKKDILILSVGPVPTEENQTVEGGGLRAWGLATGLNKNGVEVTVAIPKGFDIKDHRTKEGIDITSWDFDSLLNLCKIHKSIYVLYSRADLMEFLYRNLDPRQVVIVDLYVPIYIESLARKVPDDFDGLQKHLLNVDFWNTGFLRGDYFLCANNNQYHFYTGLLSGFGRINPITDRDSLLSIVPFGIHSEPYKQKNNVFKGIKADKKDFVILWFGGIYPWFDILPLLKATQELNQEEHSVKLLIVGAKNPFVQDRQFIKKYEDTVKLAQKMDLLDRVVFFQEWIDYQDRGDWYSEADVIINLHNPGSESDYAWRTRVVDFIWAGKPIITSGGDELSKIFAENDAAIVLKENNEANIIAAVKTIKDNQAKRDELTNNLSKLRQDLYWENVTEDLSRFIKNPKIADDRAMMLSHNFSFSPLPQKDIQPTLKKQGVLARIFKKALFIYRSEGLRSLTQRSLRYILKRIKKTAQ